MSSANNKRLFSAERKLKERLADKVGMLPAMDTSGVSNSELLTAIKAVQSELMLFRASQSAENLQRSDKPVAEKTEDEGLDEVNMLRTEVRALARSIHDTKREIKALSDNDEDRFSVVTSELDEIVGATERATETILSSAEKVDDLAQQLRQHSPDGFVSQLTDEILEQTIKMFEACNFQDLCGQRTTKVVNTLKFIEERVEKMMEIWGEENFDTVEHPDDVQAMEANRAPVGEELHGPAEHGGGISQADIDALFD